MPVLKYGVARSRNKHHTNLKFWCEVQMKNVVLSLIFVSMSSCGTIGIVSFNPADWFSKEPELIDE